MSYSVIDRVIGRCFEIRAHKKFYKVSFGSQCDVGKLNF